MRLRLPTHRPAYAVSSGAATIRIERRGPAGFVAFRLFLSAVLLVFAAMPPLAVHAFSDGSWWAPLAAVPLFTLFPWYPFLALIAWGAGAVLGSYRWIEVDGEGRRVRALRDLHFLWGRRLVEVPAAELRRVVVALEDSDLPGRVAWASLELVHEDRRWPWSSGERTTVLPFRSDELADRGRLLGLALDVARRLGRDGYAVERSDHLGARIALPATADAPGAEPVPDPGGHVRGPADPPVGEGEAPPVDLPPFEPASLDGPWRVEAWEPGVRVALRKPGLEPGELARAAVVGTLLLNLPVLLAVTAFATGAAEAGVFAKGVVLAVALSVTSLYNAYLLTEGRTARRVAFDWGEGVCRLRRDRRTVEVPLGSIERLEVRGVRRVDGSGEEDARFACEVWIRTPEGTARVAETGNGPVEAVPYVAAAALAEELAGALGVPWRWEGWEERSLLEEARSLWQRLLRRYRP